MKFQICLIACLLCGVTANAADPAIDHEAAFAEFANFEVGSWTPLDQQDFGGPRKHVYSWSLDKRFLHSDGTQDSEGPWQGMCGIDPETRKMTWWGFFADGTAGPVYLTEHRKGKWVFQGENVSSSGKADREVSIEQTASGRQLAIVIDRADGKVIARSEEAWVRYRSELASPSERPHTWRFLTGTWKFENSKGLTATMRAMLTAGETASVAHWQSPEGFQSTEIVGWRPDKKAVVVDGYGQRGNFWHVEYTDVGKDQMSGSSFARYPDGTTVEGTMTLTWQSDDLVTLKVDGKDQDGKPIKVTASWTRILPVGSEK